MVEQRRNQAQQLLVFRSTSGAQKGSDLNVGHLAARGEVGFVPHEYLA
jgi:hypothetical protein